MFDPDHLAQFKHCHSKPIPVASGNKKEGDPRSWFKNVDTTKLGMAVGSLSDSVNRQSLIHMASNPGVGTLDLCINVLAWGRMRGANRNRLFEQPVQPWITVADQVRNGLLNRAQGYDAFSNLRSGGKDMVGLGPAYFTKLLYFLAPATPSASKGYIMDQWLGCSINLLAGQQIVKLDEQVKWHLQKGKKASEAMATLRVDSFVSDVNTGKDYEAFCQAVEALSDKMGLGWTPELTERALIADGGKKPHPWRTYVVEQRLRRFGAA